MSIERTKRVKFVALISREEKPLYIQSFDSQTTRSESEKTNEFLKYNFLAHMALDVFSSPSSLSLRESQASADGILLLFIQDGISVYGFETNNLLKIVVGLGSEDIPEENVQEATSEGDIDSSKDRKDIKVHKVGKQPHDLKELIVSIHRSYLRVICNPFLNVDEYKDESESLLKSPTFDNTIVKIINQWNST